MTIDMRPRVLLLLEKAEPAGRRKVPGTPAGRAWAYQHVPFPPDAEKQTRSRQR